MESSETMAGRSMLFRELTGQDPNDKNEMKFLSSLFKKILGP